MAAKAVATLTVTPEAAARSPAIAHQLLVDGEPAFDVELPMIDELGQPEPRSSTCDVVGATRAPGARAAGGQARGAALVAFCSVWLAWLVRRTSRTKRSYSRLAARVDLPSCIRCDCADASATDARAFALMDR